LDEKTKNPEGMINAIEKLSILTGKFKFTFVSDENIEQWQTVITKKGLEDYVDFVGPLEWHETVQYYHKADAFVLFSCYETFSVVLAESFSTGTPVLSTNVGIAHHLDKDLGITVENEQQLCDAMFAMTKKDIVFDPKVIREHGMKYKSDSILNKWTSLLAQYVD